MKRQQQSGHFNPRPREEGDMTWNTYSHLYPQISIHALVKRATKFPAALRFSSAISIHALVKRATTWLSRQYQSCRISIHALVKRATSAIASHISCDLYFNPRPREEGDDTHSAIITLSGHISIHALVKRATRTAGKITRKSQISIHALVKRAT